MGTAGHIDHGKTSLIRALTGTDCDRLEEEKRRGITIELGFARLDLPGGAAVSVVDVPGHERFVRAMAAGASGIDFVLLVVAADEGVMPQTREHMEICSLLGVRAGLVALTKTDAVDEEIRLLAEEDVRGFLSGTFLENAPLVPVSARTGEGLDLLAQEIERLALALAPVRSKDIFRLPVDRVFTMRGHGTVVTGTMIGGSVSVGDMVELVPRGLRGKVRSLQSHGEAVDTAPSGRRTAVNVPDFAVDDVHKGDVLALPETLFPTFSWLVELQCLPSSPRALRHRSEAHFHHGARDVQARIYLADKEKLQPGERCLARISLPEPLAAVYGDRFVLRSFSPLRTVAGGVVLNPLGVDMRRRSKGFAERLNLLQSLVPERNSADEDKVHIQLCCTEGADKGLSFSALRVLAGLDGKVLEKALTQLSSSRRAVCFDREARLYIADVFFTALGESCLKAIKAFHAANPEKPGMPKGELLSGWGRTVPPRLAHALAEHLLKQGALQATGDALHLPAHKAAFSREQAPLSEALLAAHRKAGLAPPNLSDVLERLGATKKEVAPVLAALRQSGDLVRVAEGLWYAGEHLRALEKKVGEWFTQNETLDLAAFKEMTGLSRKYLVALLEYFDAQKITMRLGDARVLRKKS